MDYESRTIDAVVDKMLPLLDGRSRIRAKWHEDSLHWSAEKIDGKTGRRQLLYVCTRQMAAGLVGEALCTQADLNRGEWVEGEA